MASFIVTRSNGDSAPIWCEPGSSFFTVQFQTGRGVDAQPFGIPKKYRKVQLKEVLDAFRNEQGTRVRDNSWMTDHLYVYPSSWDSSGAVEAWTVEATMKWPNTEETIFHAAEAGPHQKQALSCFWNTWNTRAKNENIPSDVVITGSEKSQKIYCYVQRNP